MIMSTITSVELHISRKGLYETEINTDCVLQLNRLVVTDDIAVSSHLDS